MGHFLVLGLVDFCTSTFAPASHGLSMDYSAILGCHGPWPQGPTADFTDCAHYSLGKFPILGTTCIQPALPLDNGCQAVSCPPGSEDMTASRHPMSHIRCICIYVSGLTGIVDSQGCFREPTTIEDLIGRSRHDNKLEAKTLGVWNIPSSRKIISEVLSTDELTGREYP